MFTFVRTETHLKKQGMINEFWSQFKLGLLSYGKAFTYLREKRMYWYLPIPALLMLLIYYIGSQISAWKASWDPQLGCLECSSMNDTIWFLLKMLISITLGLVLMKFAKYIVVIVLSPMFSIISQQVEKKITGKKYPFDLQQTIHDVKRGIRIALRNLMWEYIFFLIILLVAVLGWGEPTKSPVFYLTFLIGFFYYGFSFIDYINERRRLNIDESIVFMRNNRGLAVAIGMVYSLLILVPVDLALMLDYSDFVDKPLLVLSQSLIQFLLWLMASSAPILAIIAATLAMHEKVDLSTNVWSISEEQKENNNDMVVNSSEID